MTVLFFTTFWIPPLNHLQGARNRLACVVSGLSLALLAIVLPENLVASLTYAPLSWWGSALAEDRARMQAILNRGHRWVWSGATPLCMSESFEDLDKLCLKES